MIENNIHGETLPTQELLKPKWNNLCQRLNIPDNQETFEDLVSRYSEPQRAYHTLDHIDNCLQELDSIKPSLDNPEAVELAIWFHDIVYIIGNKDNEEQSANMAREFCQKNNLSSDFTAQVESLILATKHITPNDNLDTQYLVDIDMAILGQTPDIFDKYEEQICREYSTVYSKADYQKGRIDFLETTLKKPIYLTDYFKNKYQQSAEDNIKRTINSLQN